jgi:hypothetical protein
MSTEKQDGAPPALGCIGLVRRFDFDRCCARIAIAQQRMNIAPTCDETAYWCRIWRARRRIYRIASKRELHLLA